MRPPPRTARPQRVLGGVLEQRRERRRVLFEYGSCRLVTRRLSTAAEKVWLYQTAATVGSPVNDSSKGNGNVISFHSRNDE